MKTIKHQTVYICPNCNRMLNDDHTILVPNGDIVQAYECEKCNMMFYKKSPFTSFVPLSDYESAPDKKRPSRTKKTARNTKKKEEF